MNTYSRIRAWAACPRLRLNSSAILCGALLAPMGIAIEIPSDTLSTISPDSLSTLPGDSLNVASPPKNDFERITRLTFGGGSGTYGSTIHAARTIYGGIDGCTGEPVSTTVNADFRLKHEFHDFGGELDGQLTKKFHLGVRGGVIQETGHYWGSNLSQGLVDTLFSSVKLPDNTLSTTYFNPFFSIEGKGGGFGLGIVVANNRLWTDQVVEYSDYDNASVYPTGHFRFGPLDKVYGKVSLWEGVPIYSGGGKWVSGIGVHPGPVELFGGFASGGPYTGSSVLVRGSLDVSKHVTLGGNARISKNAGSEWVPTISEGGASLFMTYKFISH